MYVCDQLIRSGCASLRSSGRARVPERTHTGRGEKQDLQARLVDKSSYRTAELGCIFVKF